MNTLVRNPDTKLPCLVEPDHTSPRCKANTNATAWLWRLKRKRSLPKEAARLGQPESTVGRI